MQEREGKTVVVMAFDEVGWDLSRASGKNEGGTATIDNVSLCKIRKLRCQGSQRIVPVGIERTKN